MQKFNHEQPQEAAYTPWTPTGVAGWPSDPIDVAVQDFLDRVCAPLIGEVPYSQRAELREELGQHLRALIQAHIELGEPHDVAIANAEEQFGRPEKLARDWTAVQSRQKPGRRMKRWFRSQWQGMCAVAAVASVVCLYMLSLSAHTAAPLLQSTSNLVKQTNASSFDQLTLSVLTRGEAFNHQQVAQQECISCHRDNLTDTNYKHYWDVRATFDDSKPSEWKFPSPVPKGSTK
jgi:hypothetical protein